MIAARDTAGSGVDDDDVAGNVLTMLLAGEDTTANTLAWMIYLLIRHPEALRRAREEVDGKNAEKYEDVSALPYVDACINETMRLKPVAPILMLEPTRDTKLGELELPAGTLIMCLMRAGATDERRFPEAQTFDPGRWSRCFRNFVETRGHALRCGPASVPGPLPGDPRDEDGDGDAAEPASRSRASPRPTAAKRRSTSRSPCRRSACA